MARFRGTVQGNRTEASRLGTPSSGLEAAADGWDLGCELKVYVGRDGEDQVRVYLTGGSNRAIQSRFLGVFKRRGSKIVKEG